MVVFQVFTFRVTKKKTQLNNRMTRQFVKMMSSHSNAKSSRWLCGVMYLFFCKLSENGLFILVIWKIVIPRYKETNAIVIKLPFEKKTLHKSISY